MRAYPRERFSSEVTLSPRMVSEFASHFSKKGAMLGLEFWVRFRRPIFADETIVLEWMVVRVTPNAKLRGEIVELRGRIKGQDGKTSLGAKGRILVTDHL